MDFRAFLPHAEVWVGFPSLGEDVLNDVFNHLVLLECLLQFEQLAGREGRSDPLWLAEGKKELWEVGACENGERENGCC